MICELDFPDADDGRWRARFAKPHRVFIAHTQEEVANVIAQAEQAARDEHWVVGFVAYEAAAAFDPALQSQSPVDNLPLAAFAVYVYDEPAADKAASSGATCGTWSMVDTQAKVAADIGVIRAAIDRGDYYQANYTTRLQATFAGEIAALYSALRSAQPDGYCASIDGGEWQIASVSPELFFDWTPDHTLTTRPMKGTAARDAAVALQDSAKERAENLMIVDLLRNDMAHVAETGSVQVTSLFDIETLPTALQMTSTVRCTTRPETTLLDIFRALFPCGSVTGAPKVATMQAIAALESSPRGVYCGAIGVIRPNGHATFNVAIRTVVVDRQKGIVTCGIGSGITLDSSAEGEYAEWLVKRRFLLRATAAFELLETLRLENGQYWLLAGHLQRLHHSAQHFGFDFDQAQVEQALQAAAKNNPQDVWRVRLLVGRNGRAKTECIALDATAEIVMVALASTPIDSSNEFLLHKTTERAVYAAHAPVTNIFDTLLYNERGEITEFTRGNVVVELDGQRITPPLPCGLLPGVLRQSMLQRGEVVERIVKREDLKRATGLWFANSVRGMLPAQLLPSLLVGEGGA